MGSPDKEGHWRWEEQIWKVLFYFVKLKNNQIWYVKAWHDWTEATELSKSNPSYIMKYIFKHKYSAKIMHLM